MKRKIVLFTLLTGVLALMSFTHTDFQKTLVGKWELQTIESNGKPPMSTKEILGDMFLEFKSDFTYIESTGGPDTKKGTWKITDGVYLQMKRDNQADFQEKEKLKEISPDKIELTHSNKSKFVFARVK
ncbi:lipocalin family protein [Cytophaga aurantiaca]|uniref:lipocalin family protein n=1 Tax=Cytophaga aurantiaca TaxID=29530 RepID=UPI000373CDF3|nr:lipocalin family protein [Cytophaga aurantiaca]